MSRQLDCSRGLNSRIARLPADDVDEATDDYPAITFESATDDNAITYSLLPPSTFQPLFTLVTSSTASGIHHPSVYYVFSDDAENEREGHDAATLAALTSLDDANAVQADSSKAVSEPEERFILVDIEPSNDPMGVQIQQVASLSPSWAISSASLRQAPTLGDEDIQDTSIMLTIEGTDIAPTKPAGRINTNKRSPADLGESAFESARRRVNGNTLDGMGELLKQLDHGSNAVDKVSDPIVHR